MFFFGVEKEVKILGGKTDIRKGEPESNLGAVLCLCIIHYMQMNRNKFCNRDLFIIVHFSDVTRWVKKARNKKKRKENLRKEEKEKTTTICTLFIFAFFFS